MKHTKYKFDFVDSKGKRLQVIVDREFVLVKEESEIKNLIDQVGQILLDKKVDEVEKVDEVDERENFYADDYYYSRNITDIICSTIGFLLSLIALVSLLLGIFLGIWYGYPVFEEILKEILERNTGKG